jgi:hypothetical protein
MRMNFRRIRRQIQELQGNKSFAHLYSMKRRRSFFPPRREEDFKSKPRSEDGAERSNVSNVRPEDGVMTFNSYHPSQEEHKELTARITYVETDLEEVKASLEEVKASLDEVKAGVERLEVDMREGLERLEVDMREVKASLAGVKVCCMLIGGESHMQ